MDLGKPKKRLSIDRRVDELPAEPAEPLPVAEPDEADA
jgi:hypothetical protein